MAKHFPTQPVCQALQVSRSGFYAHRTKPERPRRKRDAELKPKIQKAFEQSRHTYGSPRILIELQREGERCGRNRVARLMGMLGLRAITKRRFKPCTTTQSDPKLAVSPNWLKQIPRPNAPDQVWISDITYLPTREGWHYLAVTMDLFSRRVVGWATGSSLETTLVAKALERAIAMRGKPPGLIHHSDRGCQYASREYRNALNAAGITSSMSRKGNCYDNATMESFFATLKTEVFNRHIAQTRHQAQLLVFDYIETFYNPKRIHTSLGGKSPLEFEMLHQTHFNPLVHCPHF
jgi:transposase InsO family protein